MKPALKSSTHSTGFLCGRKPAGEMHYKDHSSLSDDGATLTMAHRDDDFAGQTTILHRL